MRLAWPLTGRAEEMGVIDAALSDPDSSGVVIRGASGVGKSRVAREGLRSAALRGCQTRWVIGTSVAQALPLGAFVSLAGHGGTDSLQVVRGVIEALTSAPDGVRAVVGVDDVHLLDDLSTLVVHQLVQHRTAQVVLTVRDGDPVPAGTQEIWRSGRFDRLDLQPLSRDETTGLVTSTLGGFLDPDVAQRLWELTRGNPLYLRNIVEQEIDDGRLEQRHGYWRWRGDPVMPPGLVELIESRIGALPNPVGEVIDVLAVGEPVELAALTRITDSAAVEDAETRGLITLDQVDGRVEARVAHPLYGEVRRKRAAVTRLRRLRGLVAAELACGADRDDVRTVVRRAALTLEADVAPDADLLVRAAQGASSMADLGLAGRLADAAIDAGGGAEASFVRAHTLARFGRGAQADAVLGDIPTRELTDLDRARVAFLRANNKLWALADPSGAKELIDAASDTTPPGARGSVDAFLTEYWAAMGRPDVAMEASKGIVLEELPGFVSGVAAWGLAVAAGDSGRPVQAAGAADAGYSIIRRSADAAHLRFIIADGHVGALVQAGLLAEADDVAEGVRQFATDLPGAAQLFGNAVAGRAALGNGRLDAACELLRPMVEMLAAVGEPSGWGYRYQLPYTMALAMRGATDASTKALAALQKNQHPSWRCVNYERELASAWVAAAQGAVSAACGIAMSAAENARSNGQFAPEVVCLQTAAQLGDGSCSPRLDELTEVVGGPASGSQPASRGRYVLAMALNSRPRPRSSSNWVT